MKSLKLIVRLLVASFKDLLPIILVISFFQIFILQQTPNNLESIIMGLIIVAIELTIFIQDLKLGIFPIGEKLSGIPEKRLVNFKKVSNQKNKHA